MARRCRTPPPGNGRQTAIIPYYENEIRTIFFLFDRNHSISSPIRLDSPFYDIIVRNVFRIVRLSDRDTGKEGGNERRSEPRPHYSPTWKPRGWADSVEREKINYNQQKQLFIFFFNL